MTTLALAHDIIDAAALTPPDPHLNHHITCPDQAVTTVAELEARVVHLDDFAAMAPVPLDGGETPD